MMATSPAAAADTSYPIRLQGVAPPPLPIRAGSKPSKSSSSSKSTQSHPQPQQRQQRHIVQIVPSQTTLPQLRLDAYRLFGAGLGDYDVELRAGFPPKLIGPTGEGDEDEETLVRDFVGRNESVTVRFVPSGGRSKQSNANAIRTSGSGVVGVGGAAGGGGGSGSGSAARGRARAAASATAAGRKRSRPAAAAAAPADDDDSDEDAYDPRRAGDDADDGGSDGDGGADGQDAATGGGRRSRRAAAAAAAAAMPAVIREQDRLMAAQGGDGRGGRKKKAAKKKGGDWGSSNNNSHRHLAAARAAAAEERAAAAAARRMAAMPGRRLGDGSDVAPTAAAPAERRRKKKKGGGGASTLFGGMSSEDDVSYALMGSMAGGGAGGAGGKIGKVLRTAMKGAVGKSYEASRAVVRVDAVRAGRFRIVAKSDATAGNGAGAGASAGTGASGGSGTASASHVGMYVARYSKGVEGRGEYEEDVEIIALEALRAVVAAVHADHHSDDDGDSLEGGGGGSGREMLRPASMAQLSPRVFWSLAHHFPGKSTEDALRALLPNLDWSFLDGRSRMLSEKARENLRQEKVARGEMDDEADEGAGGDDGGIAAIEAVEKAMEDVAEHDRSNARERAARAALARFDGASPSKVSANVAAATDKTGLSGSVQPETWKLVTPTDEDEDELAECIREGFASSEGGAYEATESDMKAWTAALMNQCSVHNWRELANVTEGSSIASLMSVATPDQDRPTSSDVDGWIEAARGRSVEEIAMEIVDGNEEAYVALRDAARAGTPKDLFAWRAMTDMLLEEVQGYEGADVSDVTEADLKRWCTRAGIALNEADWLIWYATPSA